MSLHHNASLLIALAAFACGSGSGSGPAASDPELLPVTTIPA